MPCQPVPDVSEELSRQLEDILSTYCRDSNQEGPGEDNGQNESVELDEPEKCRSESPRNGDQEQSCPEINGEKEGPRGIGDESGERDQKRIQEKKKPRGLGRKFSADRPAFPLFFQKADNEEARGRDVCTERLPFYTHPSPVAKSSQLSVSLRKLARRALAVKMLILDGATHVKSFGVIFGIPQATCHLRWLCN